jgi:hypothetical protein
MPINAATWARKLIAVPDIAENELLDDILGGLAIDDNVVVGPVHTQADGTICFVILYLDRCGEIQVSEGVASADEIGEHRVMFIDAFRKLKANVHAFDDLDALATKARELWWDEIVERTDRTAKSRV